MPPPILSPQQIAETVVDRLCGYASPASIATRELLVSLDPQSVRLADCYERRARAVLEHLPNSVEHFEQLTGRRLEGGAREGS